uniref:Protein V2 n=1 Tax=Jatropha leaf yellow mosaic Katarniaghat virus TaxID=1530093 RepID=I6QUM6_9GEMI|nr:pre-coat protein [Jatropha leaf yellow mosaic Katarniaghat virus]
MWDPLLNDFPDSVHGFRCMLALKYLQLVESTYSPDTLGYDLIRDLISVIRARSYVEASCRYHHFNSRLESTSPSELRQPVQQPCSCPHCPRHKKAGLVEQAHEPQAQVLQDVQESGCA